MSRTRRMLAGTAASVLLTGAGVVAAAATGAAPAEAAAKASCSDSYVVVSMPLRDTANGQSSWNYGYVQLWYDGCTGDNWSRVVSLLGGTSSEWAEVYNTAGVSSPVTCTTGATITVSKSIHSPVANAGAFGEVTASGVAYYAESDQSGASQVQDGSNGACS